MQDIGSARAVNSGNEQRVALQRYICVANAIYFSAEKCDILLTQYDIFSRGENVKV